MCERHQTLSKALDIWSTTTREAPDKVNLFLTGIYTMQDWTVTTRHEVVRTKERKEKYEWGLEEPKSKNCLLTLDLKPFRL